MGSMDTQHPFTLALARELRIALDDSPLRFRKDLAEASGVPIRTLKRYLDGEREIPLTELRSIARALGVSVASLIDCAEDRLGRD
jgi:transcriptional regulator with XRE-family HTH domain